MSALDEITKAELRPQDVSGFLGVKGSELPRIVANTIGSPTEPPRKRGAAGGYSKLDAALIRLGKDLLYDGLFTPSRTRLACAMVKAWLEKALPETQDFNDLAFGLCPLLLGYQDGTKWYTRLVDLEFFTRLLSE